MGAYHAPAIHPLPSPTDIGDGVAIAPHAPVGYFQGPIAAMPYPPGANFRPAPTPMYQVRAAQAGHAVDGERALKNRPRLCTLRALHSRASPSTTWCGRSKCPVRVVAAGTPRFLPRQSLTAPAIQEGALPTGPVPWPQPAPQMYAYPVAQPVYQAAPRAGSKEPLVSPGEFYAVDPRAGYYGAPAVGQPIPVYPNYAPGASLALRAAKHAVGDRSRGEWLA